MCRSHDCAQRYSTCAQMNTASTAPAAACTACAIVLTVRDYYDSEVLRQSGDVLLFILRIAPICNCRCKHVLQDLHRLVLYMLCITASGSLKLRLICSKVTFSLSVRWASSSPNPST